MNRRVQFVGDQYEGGQYEGDQYVGIDVNPQ